jgi:hypothetical protein
LVPAVQVAEIDVVHVELLSVSSLGRVMVSLRREGTEALTVKGFVTIILSKEAESKTSWLLGVYPTVRVTGCIEMLAVPFSI